MIDIYDNVQERSLLVLRRVVLLLLLLLLLSMESQQTRIEQKLRSCSMIVHVVVSNDYLYDAFRLADGMQISIAERIEKVSNEQKKDFIAFSLFY